MLAQQSPVSIMRLSDIVNTVAAYQTLGMLYGQRAVNGSAATGDQADQKNIAAMSEIDAITQTEPSTEQDQVDLSYLPGEQEAAIAQEADDSLGSIIESFIRERQVVNYTIPGIAGLTSPINVTYEVEQAYRVIDFVPRGKQVDTQA